MGKQKAIVAAFASIFLVDCSTTESVRFTALETQSSVIRDGIPAIVSRKSRSIVLVSPASRGMQAGHRVVFIVAATNLTHQPVDLHVSDISVSQQLPDGSFAPLPIIQYEQLESEERTGKSPRRFSLGSLPELTHIPPAMQATGV
jgi:hypothetical protein